MRNLPVKGLIALTMVSGLLAGCDKSEDATYPTLDRQTPGIFLEPDERAVLPPGMELRPVYDKGINLTKE
jgi:outer membrane protein assembly factor BamE (lipoprotein component of BamABCDE complex)